MRIQKPLTTAIERGAGVSPGQLDGFVGKPAEALAAFIQALPDDSPLKPFEGLLVSSVQADPVEDKPKAWMIKRGDEFVRTEQPPELGTETFKGSFQKKVIPGGYDMRGEKNADTTKWIPGANVRSEPFDGAGDPNVQQIPPPSAGGADTFMIKRGESFAQVSSPPDLGTEVFFGTFQKRVIPGGRDMRGERNADRTKWIPGKDVASEKYEGAAGDVEDF